jgi:bacterial/archaeal transporter family-2 protein
VDRGAAVALTAVAGGLIALQAPINSTLGRAVGTLQGALVSFVIGTAVLLVLAAVAHGGLGAVGEARHVAPYYLMGGVLGAIYVTCALVTVRSLGAGGVTAATIAGQLGASAVVDHLGLLGVEREPITPVRVAGIALLAVGVFLVVRP